MVRAHLAALKQFFSPETALSSTRDIHEPLLAQKYDSACMGSSMNPYVVFDGKLCHCCVCTVACSCICLSDGSIATKLGPVSPKILHSYHNMLASWHAWVYFVIADCDECNASVANQSCRPFQTYKSRCVSDRAYVSGGGFTLIVSQHRQYIMLCYSQAGYFGSQQRRSLWTCL